MGGTTASADAQAMAPGSATAETTDTGNEDPSAGAMADPNAATAADPNAASGGAGAPATLSKAKAAKAAKSKKAAKS